MDGDNGVIAGTGDAVLWRHHFSPAAWTQVLQNIDRAFRHNRDNIENTAEELSVHLLRSRS